MNEALRPACQASRQIDPAFGRSRFLGHGDWNTRLKQRGTSAHLLVHNMLSGGFQLAGFSSSSTQQLVNMSQELSDVQLR
jgi:hypothetical protein